MYGNARKKRAKRLPNYDYDLIFAWMTSTGATPAQAAAKFAGRVGTIQAAVYRESKRPSNRLAKWAPGIPSGEGMPEPDASGPGGIGLRPPRGRSSRPPEDDDETDYSGLSPEEYRARLLEDIRAMRTRSAGMTYASLARQELALLAQVEADRQAAEAEAGEECTEDEMIRAFAADWHDLPEAIRRRIRSIVLDGE